MRYAIILIILLPSLLTTGCDLAGVTLVPDLTRVGIPVDYVEHLNTAAGYTVKHPSDMVLDLSMSAVRSVLLGEGTTIEIYVQEHTSSRSYISYGNTPVLTGRDQVEILKNTDKLVNLRRVRELWWKRPVLVQVPEDEPFYASVDIAAGLNRTYTLFFKSSDFVELQRIVPPMIRSFRPVKTSGEASISLPLSVERATSLTQEAADLLQKLRTENKQSWGIFDPYYPLETEQLMELENRLDHFFEYVLLYGNFDTGRPAARLAVAGADGRVPVLTLQTFSPAEGFTTAMTYELLSGKYEAFLRAYARDVAAFGQPVVFRFNNEMNGDWCAYSAYHSSKDAELYVESYRYVYRIFAEEGAHNALWVWNPHDGSFPDFMWNHYLTYYPGDAYVDIVGLTGYNAGTYYKGEKWRGFTEIYDPLYFEYDSLFPGKALMITEFASNSVGGDKVAWIEEAMAHLPDYPRISVAIWWNHCDFDGDTPSRIYKLDENEATLEAFKSGLKSYP